MKKKPQIYSLFPKILVKIHNKDFLTNYRVCKVLHFEYLRVNNPGNSHHSGIFHGFVSYRIVYLEHEEAKEVSRSP